MPCFIIQIPPRNLMCLYFQALSSFSAALQSGQLGPLMSQFDLGEDVATAATQGGKSEGLAGEWAFSLLSTWQMEGIKFIQVYCWCMYGEGGIKGSLYS